MRKQKQATTQGYVEATDIQDAEIKGRIYCIKNKMKFVAVDFDDNDNEGLTY